MIVVRIWEGLGNQMFQYAYARALHERGYRVALDLDKAYESNYYKNRREAVRKNAIQKFNITLPVMRVEKCSRYNFLARNTLKDRIIFWLSERGLWPVTYYREKEAGYKKMLRCVPRYGNYYLQGTFQSESYFEDIRSVLLGEFTLRNEVVLSDELKALLEKKNTVSIHIRRGDYVKFNHALNIYYYKKAMAEIKKHIKNPVFLVFTDDVSWVRENLVFDDPCMYVCEMGEFHDYEELIIMSRCTNQIISNSTFSWWGAWLNVNEDKIVIAPKVWCGCEKQNELNRKDWIIV